MNLQRLHLPRWAVLSLAAIFICSGLWAEEEVMIKNKPLSKWLKQVTGSNRGKQMRAARALNQAPKETYPQLVIKITPILESSRKNDRFIAAQILGKCGPLARSAVPKLIPLLKGTQYERNRTSAAKALGLILKDAKPSEEIETVVKALTAKFNEDYDKYSDVRREAVRALGMIGPAAKSCVPKLLRGLKDYKIHSNEHDMVRQQAAWTCSRMGPHAAQHMDLLISMMHKEGHQRPEIVDAIGSIGAIHENVVPNLVDKIEVCGRRYVACRISAMKALEKFGPKSARSVPFLMAYLKGELKARGPVAPMVAACNVLGAVGPKAKSALPILKTLTTFKFHPHAEISGADHNRLHAAAKKAVAGIGGGAEVMASAKEAPKKKKKKKVVKRK